MIHAVYVFLSLFLEKGYEYYQAVNTNSIHIAFLNGQRHLQQRDGHLSALRREAYRLALYVLGRFRVQSCVPVTTAKIKLCVSVYTDVHYVCIDMYLLIN